MSILVCQIRLTTEPSNASCWGTSVPNSGDSITSTQGELSSPDLPSSLRMNSLLYQSSNYNMNHLLYKSNSSNMEMMTVFNSMMTTLVHHQLVLLLLQQMMKDSLLFLFGIDPQNRTQ